ncbi:MAG: hypothetical protein ACOX9B_08170 [Candidatus Xenobium sp.]|jgi:uncharacterized coiled-coil protein SlyX|nr:hypothetical protein [Burkholderiales bacterium]
MEPQDLELRLQSLKEELKADLDALQHAQKMRSMSADQQLDGALEHLRRDLATITTRMVSNSEFQQLRQTVEALGAAREQGGPGNEVLELLPRFMQELTRLREQTGTSHSPQPPATSQVQAIQARLDELGHQIKTLAERGEALRAQDLEARLGREAEERKQQFEALRNALQGLEGKLSKTPAREAQPPQPGSGTSVDLDSEALQTLRREMEAGLEAVRTAIPTAIAELRRQLPPSRDYRPDIENLKSRLEALESQEGAAAAMPSPEGRKYEDLSAGLKGLSQRLEVLEARKHEDLSARLWDLSRRLESLESAVAGEREHVREVFRDLLDEQEMLLHRLDSRLNLLVQDFHRLSEAQNQSS